MNDFGVRLVSDLWLAVGVLWLLGSIGNKTAVRRQTFASRIFELGTAVLGFTLMFNRNLPVPLLRLRFVPASSTVLSGTISGTLEWTGVVMTIAGILFAVWARLTMGGNWSAAVTVKQDHVLMQRGPFALVRHPIYAGFLLALLGTALVVGELRCLLGLIAIGLAFLSKMGIEEGFLLQRFGSEYVQYQREVKALIPRVF
jgi:protein-S-isoprenylcysteine O-methyltransferase Ste14